MRRRSFMTAVAGTAGAALTLQCSSRSEAHEWLSTSAGGPAVRRATFAAWLDSTFHVRAPGAVRSQRARLIAIEDGPLAAGLEQFHLVFEHSGSAPSGLCVLRHEGGAVLPLRLDSLASRGEANRSRATFCLIVPA